MDSLCHLSSVSYGMGNKAKADCVAHSKYLRIRGMAGFICINPHVFICVNARREKTGDRKISDCKDQDVSIKGSPIREIV